MRSRATYARRRAVAAGIVVLAVGAPAFALTRGSGEEAPAPLARAVPRPARPAARTDVAAVASRATVPVLCYHQIRPITGSDSARDRTYIVPAKALDAQLGALEDAGYTSVTADAVADHMAKGTKLPPKPILITFDDASAGQYTRALPLLRKHGMRATFYVMTVVLGKEGWLSKRQVRGLDRGGMEIGVHTWDHSAVPDYADDAWTAQLTEPKAELEEIVGHPLDTFAYPFGLWNAAAFAHLEQAGVRLAFQLGDALDAAHPMLTARRVLVGPDVGPAELLGMVRQDF